jgi:hypothetical protein
LRAKRGAEREKRADDERAVHAERCCSSHW